MKKFEEHRSDAVLKLLPITDKMLDVGCGKGDFAIKASKIIKYVYGVDVSRFLILKAKDSLKKNKIKNVFFTTCDVNKGLPFAKRYFNIVTAVASLAFFTDPYFVTSEFNRVLKHNGVLIVEVPNMAYFPRRLSLLFGGLPKVASVKSGWDGGHLHNFTKNAIEKLIKESGFKIIKVTGSGIFASLRNWWPSLLCGNIIIKAVKK